MSPKMAKYLPSPPRCKKSFSVGAKFNDLAGRRSAILSGPMAKPSFSFWYKTKNPANYDGVMFDDLAATYSPTG